jgi:hypothetical protein
MAGPAHDLTGVWHGRFTYPHSFEPGTFVATLVEAASRLSGMIEEPCTIGLAAGTTLHAAVSGARRDSAVAFLKTYDGTGGWVHTVAYEGALSGDGMEIEGRWRVSGAWSGSFLMIRSTGLPEAVEREEFAPA